MATNPNMELIQAVTIGAGGAASIDFTSIPQTYTDLCLFTSLRTDRATTQDGLTLEFNASSANFTRRELTGNGASTSSGSASNGFAGNIDAASATASTFSNNQIYIPNYTGSTNKSYSADSVQETNATTAYAVLVSGLWSQTTAISRITLKSDNAANFVQHSTAYLYGVTAANYGAKATGGIITQDADYFYHTFTSSGTFSPTQSIAADFLVVAGAGGGGAAGGAAGGGGAGGLRALTSQSLTVQNYSVTVGAGGAGANYSTQRFGSDGSNSQFGALLTSTGGGGGGGWQGGVGRTGGSGGGGCGNSGGAGTGGTGTSGQGTNGGNGTINSGTSSNVAGGGGGGAVSAGSNGNATGYVPGAGGAGSSAYSSWGLATNTGHNVSGTVFYAGGGGASASSSGVINFSVGGNGGGGTSNGSNTTGDGMANTGGGGAADKSAYGTSTGGSGGSGIVIVRYAK